MIIMSEKNYDKEKKIDLSRLFKIQDYGFLALACNAAEEKLLLDLTGKTEKGFYHPGYTFYGLYEENREILEKEFGLDKKLIDKISAQRKISGNVRHCFAPMPPDEALSYLRTLAEIAGSDLLKDRFSGFDEFERELKKRSGNMESLFDTYACFDKMKKENEVYLKEKKKTQEEAEKTYFENENLRKKKEELESEVLKGKNKIKELREQNAALRKDNRNDKEEKEKLDEKIRSLLNDNAGKEMEIDELNRKLEENSWADRYMDKLTEIGMYALDRRTYEKSVMILSEEQREISEGALFGKAIEKNENKDFLIKGCAGSGKTLILLNLFSRMKKEGEKCVYLTYTNNLVEFVKYTAPLISKEIGEGDICNKDKFIREFAKKEFEIDSFFGSDYEAEYNRFLNSLKDCFSFQHDNKVMYDYVFVDEVQDLSTDELFILKKIARKSLVMAGDSSQSIWKKNGSFKQAGIGIVGRTRNLKRNYRNTIQINSFAEKYKKILIRRNSGEKNVEKLLESVDESQAVRYGLDVRFFPEEKGKIVFSVVSRVKDILKFDEYKSESVCILTVSKEDARTIEELLKNEGIEVCSYRGKVSSGYGKRSSGPGTFDFNKKGVKVSTVHSAKGIDFPYVLFLADPDNGKTKNKLSYELVYTAITRAMDRLEVFANPMSENESVRDLVELLESNKNGKIEIQEEEDELEKYDDELDDSEVTF